VLGRFVIPIYYVLGERLIGSGTRTAQPVQAMAADHGDGRGSRSPDADVVEVVEG
jgi:hypothetical protein